jgi:hypothetical protein
MGKNFIVVDPIVSPHLKDKKICLFSRLCLHTFCIKARESCTRARRPKPDPEYKSLPSQQGRHVDEVSTAPEFPLGPYAIHQATATPIEHSTILLIPHAPSRESEQGIEGLPTSFNLVTLF